MDQTSESSTISLSWKQDTGNKSQATHHLSKLIIFDKFVALIHDGIVIRDLLLTHMLVEDEGCLEVGDTLDSFSLLLCTPLTLLLCEVSFAIRSLRRRFKCLAEGVVVRVQHTCCSDSLRPVGCNVVSDDYPIAQKELYHRTGRYLAVAGRRHATPPLTMANMNGSSSISCLFHRSPTSSIEGGPFAKAIQSN